MRENGKKQTPDVGPAKDNEPIFSAFLAWKWFAAGLK